jgi:enamine deaminase RidA (YjgF/YER057c/UK114 family)
MPATGNLSERRPPELTLPELVFVGQIAPAAAALGEPLVRQVGSALSRLERTLAERELVLEDLLRLRLFVRDLDELPALERAIAGAIGSSGPAERPAMSIVELPTGSSPGAAVTLDAVAAPGAREQRRLRPHSVRFGPWVFVGATPGIASRRGVLRRRRVRDASRASFARMEELLRAQGAELRDVVSVGGWLTFPMRDYGPLAEVRTALLDRTGLMPVSAGVQVARVGAAGELLSLEAIAFAPEDRAERTQGGASAPPPSRLARFYADARTAGGYVFTSGEVPDGRGSVRTQAREVYERLGSHLTAHGASPAAVVQQTVFVRRAGDGEAVAAAAREFYGDGVPLPPATLLSVADIGFHPGCDVEIELVASADGRSADDR